MKQLKKDNAGVIGLYYNDTPLICPLTPPVVLPGHMAGTAAIHQRHCNQLCPLFDATQENINGTKKEKLWNVFLCQKSYLVLPLNAPETAPKSSIITLGNENKAL